MNQAPENKNAENPASVKSGNKNKRGSSDSKRGGARSKSSSKSRSQSKSSSNPLTYPFRFLASAIRHWNPKRMLVGAWRTMVGVFKWLVWGPTTPKAKSAVKRETSLQWPSGKSMRNPLNWASWAWTACGRYATTRSLRSVVLSFPAIGFFIAFVSSVSLGLKDGAGNQTGRYGYYLSLAVENENLVEARVCTKRMLLDSPSDDQVRLRRALLEKEMGDEEVAKNMMSDLAKYGDSAFAAMWLAENVGDKSRMQDWSNEELREYADWLVNASVNAPDNPQPRLALADILVKLGDLGRARAVLMKPAKRDYESAYQLVLIENRLGETNVAKQRADALLPAMQSQLIRSPANSKLRLQAADLMVFLKRGDEAISTLRGGLMHAKTDENRSMLNAALTAALLSEAQKPLGSDATAATMLRRFRLLEEASELDPKSQAVTQCIVNACIASYQFRDIAVEQARDSFYGLLSEENLRFIEGTVAIHAGDIRSAKTLLAADAEEDASSPGVLNNLAHAILQEKEPDLQEALNLCNAAVEALPNHAYFRETRGQVLFRLARYGEAIKDLEIAFLAPELRPGIQMMMLKCYQELKLSEKEAQLKQWIISQRTATQP